MTLRTIASLAAAAAFALGGGTVAAAAWSDTSHRTGVVVADQAPSGGLEPAAAPPVDVTWGG